MGADKINDQKIITVAAIVICWIIILLNLCGVWKPFLRRPLISSNTNTNTKTKPIIVTYSNPRTDVYDISGDVRIAGSSSTIFIASTGADELPWNGSKTIKPSPQKKDRYAMTFVTDFTMKTGLPDTIPSCTRYLDAPAILFSSGHIVNQFHQFASVLIPLFAASHRFHRHVVLLVTDHDSRVNAKHKETLKRLSEYKVYDIDVEDEILCFPRMIVGLKAQSIGLSIDPAQTSSLSMRNFTKFMRSVYSLRRNSVHSRPRPPRPRMLVVTRKAKRRLTNHVEVVDMARSLGFETIAQDFKRSMTSVAELLNSIDVMVGVHGAGLTNMIFLPENAVVVQITPLGLDDFAFLCYGGAQAEEMNLKYLEYKVMVNESSLLGKYPPNSEIYNDSVNFCQKEFKKCKSVFLDNQDVNLDLARFRKTLLQALDLLAA